MICVLGYYTYTELIDTEYPTTPGCMTLGQQRVTTIRVVHRVELNDVRIPWKKKSNVVMQTLIPLILPMELPHWMRSHPVGNDSDESHGSSGSIDEESSSNTSD